MRSPFVSPILLHLGPGVREHFMDFLARIYPELLVDYWRLYAGKYAPVAYRAEVRNVIGMLRTKYGLHERERVQPDTASPALREAEQQMIKWSTRR